ncbi:putative general amidase [Phaeomoniella chlamydospora]|uniref:amidase n=1 Tax=Phaeomoniella chlamydospora TaxID=158046 RepID=A0A0G2EFZ5_PHACM|nr:putative general amidase [Phaeomoniella chlamydospora]
MGWEELQEKCKAKKIAQRDAIPRDLILKESPPDSQTNVLDVPKQCGLLTSTELEITELDDVNELLARLANGTWSAVDVTSAYCKRAMIAHQLTNCLSEFWIKDALSQAHQLDESLRKTGPVGPLHGLPISLKDQFDVGGKENNMGLATWLGRISDEDASLVKILRAAGAVIYTRTNVPMTLMMPETVNHVYGRTVNPRNRTLTSGGSSGGEAALLALKGSPLGVGTDLGGSIRNPAALNNLYGLRPTMRRLPYLGASNTLLGQESIESSLGPIARSLAACSTFFKAIIDGAPWDYDPKVVEIKWREDMYQLKQLGGKGSKLCFGYYDYDGVVMPQPPVRRAIALTVEALKRAGHTVIEFPPLNHAEALSILQRTFASDNGEEFKRLFGESKEPLLPGIDDVSKFPPITVNEAWQLNLERDAFRRRYLDAWLATKQVSGTGRPIDGLICPVAPFPPPPHGQYIYAGYTCVFNVLDMPSAVVPVTFVDASVDLPDRAYIPKNELDKAVHEMYDSPDTFKDAPVGVQIVGRRWREEEVLGVANVVDEALQAVR